LARINFILKTSSGGSFFAKKGEERMKEKIESLDEIKMLEKEGKIDKKLK
jgi:hypothetical protein